MALRKRADHVRLLFDYYCKKSRRPCTARPPGFFHKSPRIYAISTKPLHCNVLRSGSLIIPTLKAAGSNPVGRTKTTKTWRQKDVSHEKARFCRAFLLPKRRFFSVPKRRCKIAVFPLWIDLNSRKVNIRYTGR